MSALNQQVGGDHYKDLKIQPVEYITQNGLGYLEGNVIKYVTRYKNKNGRQDLLKARHYIDMLLEQYGSTDEPEKLAETEKCGDTVKKPPVVMTFDNIRTSASPALTLRVVVTEYGSLRIVGRARDGFNFDNMMAWLSKEIRKAGLHGAPTLLSFEDHSFYVDVY